MILFLLERKRRWGLLSEKCYQTLFKCSHLKRIKGNVIRQWIYSGELYQATQCRLNEALRPFWKKYNNSINQLGSPVIYGGHPALYGGSFLYHATAALGRLREGGKLPVHSSHIPSLSHIQCLFVLWPPFLSAWPGLGGGHSQGAA